MASHYDLLLTHKKNSEEDAVGDQLLQGCLDLSVNIVLRSQLLLSLPDGLDETSGTPGPSNKTVPYCSRDKSFSLLFCIFLFLFLIIVRELERFSDLIRSDGLHLGHYYKSTVAVEWRDFT